MQTVEERGRFSLSLYSKIRGKLRVKVTCVCFLHVRCMLKDSTPPAGTRLVQLLINNSDLLDCCTVSAMRPPLKAYAQSGDICEDN